MKRIGTCIKNREKCEGVGMKACDYLWSPGKQFANGFKKWRKWYCYYHDQYISVIKTCKSFYEKDK